MRWRLSAPPFAPTGAGIERSEKVEIGTPTRIVAIATEYGIHAYDGMRAVGCKFSRELQLPHFPAVGIVAAGEKQPIQPGFGHVHSDGARLTGKTNLAGWRLATSWIG